MKYGEQKPLAATEEDARRDYHAGVAAARGHKAHGKKVVARVREENPMVYFKYILSLPPKDVSLQGHIGRAPGSVFVLNPRAMTLTLSNCHLGQ